MGVHVAQMTSQDGVRAAYDAVTTAPAKILHLEGYGLDVGCRANLVVLQAADPFEAIRLKAARLFVLRDGRVVARSPERRTALALAGRPESLTLEFVPGSIR